MWTRTRRRHSREHLRYASDVSDEEWALLEPHLPAPCLTGRPRAWPMREIVNAIFYVLRSGCAWLLPDSFPLRQTVYGWFLRLRDDCVGAAEPPSGHARPRAQRARATFGGGAHSQSVKTTGRRAEGYDAGKKIKGRKRQPSSTPTVVPWRWSLTRPTSRTATAAGPCWRPRATPFPSSRRSSPTAATPGSGLPAPPPSPSRSFAEPGPGWLRRPAPRWVVERFFAWIGRNRRLAKDFEATLESARAFLYAASIMLLTRRLAQSG